MSNSVGPPPLSELSLYALCVFLPINPFAMFYYQYYRYYSHYYYYLYYYYSICNSDFSTSICPVFNGAMKIIGSNIYRYRKKTYWNLYYYWPYFFSLRYMCLTIYISKWLFKHGLSDEQPWTSWGIFFSGSRYFRFASMAPYVLRWTFTLNDPPRSLWHNYFLYYPFLNFLFFLTLYKIKKL
jgi:hypothetical protein